MIGPLNDDVSLKSYFNSPLKRFIEEQVVYLPNSERVIYQCIVTAGSLFEAVIIRNEIPLTDMPPVRQILLDDVKNKEVT